MARVPIDMPRFGSETATGTIASWHRQVGDVVARGDVIAEIEAEKTTLEMESTASGVLVEIVHEAGAEVPGGGVIAYLEDGK